MKKHRTLVQNSIVLIVAVGSFGLLYLTGNGWTSGNTNQVQSKGAIPAVKVESKVESLEILSVEKADQSVQLNFKNNSNKAIKGFVLQKNAGQKSFVHLSDENKIVPGMTHTETFRVLPSEKQRVAAILAVIYDDGKGEGESAVIQELFDMLLGEQMQNERIYGYLKKFSTTSRNKLLPLLASTKEAIKNLPDDQDVSDFMKIGLHNAKESALLDLDKLELDLKENNEIKIKHRIYHLEMTYEKKAAKNKL